jgi:hypothetical protein
VSLKRSLNADSKVSPIGGGEPLTGKANLKINSTAESTYMCIVGINTSLEPIFASIQVCRDEKGKDELGFFDITAPFGDLQDLISISNAKASLAVEGP